MTIAPIHITQSHRTSGLFTKKHVPVAKVLRSSPWNPFTLPPSHSARARKRGCNRVPSIPRSSFLTPDQTSDRCSMSMASRRRLGESLLRGRYWRRWAVMHGSRERGVTRDGRAIRGVHFLLRTCLADSIEFMRRRHRGCRIRCASNVGLPGRTNRTYFSFVLNSKN